MRITGFLEGHPDHLEGMEAEKSGEPLRTVNQGREHGVSAESGLQHLSAQHQYQAEIYSSRKWVTLPGTPRKHVAKPGLDPACLSPKTCPPQLRICVLSFGVIKPTKHLLPHMLFWGKSQAESNEAECLPCCCFYRADWHCQLMLS